MWSIVFYSRNAEQVARVASAFGGVPRISVEHRRDPRDMEGFGVLYLSRSGAEDSGVVPGPYEAIVTPRWPTAPAHFPEHVVIGGVLDKEDDPMSLDAAARMFQSVVRSLVQYDSLHPSDQNILGLVIEQWFFDDSVPVEQQASAFQRIVESAASLRMN